MKDLSSVRVYVFSHQDGEGSEPKIRRAVSRYLKENAPDREEAFRQGAELCRTERGKPYFPAFPEVFFSVSHSGSFLVCAVSDGPVGVDLQIHERRKGESEEEAFLRLSAIAKRFFSPAESEFVSQFSDLRRFFLLWTARESYVKLNGRGIDDDFPRFSVLPENKSVFFASEPFCWTALEKHFLVQPFGAEATLCLCTEEKRTLHTVWMDQKI